MKKYISRRLYDTDTAHALGTFEPSGIEPGDLNWYEETLYRKRNGEHFLHGCGGAASRYSRAVGENSWEGSEAIRPLSYDTARTWAKEHLSADEFEAAFGAPGSDDTSMLHIEVPASIKARLDEERSRTGRPQAAIIVDALEEWFSRS